MRWGIVCPGPSMNLYRSYKQVMSANLDVKVAVNGAILISLWFDYWAIMDLEVFGYCARICSPVDIAIQKPVLWIPERWEGDICETSPLHPYFQRYQKETFPSTSNEALAQIIPLGKDIQWRERTMFVAIALAIIKGAEEIRLFGADLCGQGYFQSGLENCRTRHTEKRWNEEKYWLDRIILSCAQKGISVIREVLP
jgi:hypothetical protein